MNSAEFFNAYFGQHLTPQTGNAVKDAQATLNGGHKMAKGGAPQRIANGWAVVSPAGSTLQFKLAAQGLTYSDKTRYEGWSEALEGFTRGDAIMLIEFDKKPVPVSHLHRTFDLRAVHICSPTGVDVFDLTQEPTKQACIAHKQLWKLKHA